MKMGIVGLPNVGKSTLFNAITKAGAECANYPFCTIEPNVGVVAVPDERLTKLAEIYKPQKVTPAVIEFVDIAGLVKGASHGELGLGGLDLALQPLGTHLPDLFGLIGRLVVRAAPEDAGGDLPVQGPQQGVIPVEDGQIVAGHGLEDLALGL